MNTIPTLNHPVKRFASELKPQIALGFSITFLILILIGWMNYDSLSQFIDSSQWQTHTLKVLNTLSNLQITIYEARSQQRGYILTDRSSYLDAYHDKIQSILTQYNALDGLIDHNTEQQKRIKQLKPLIQDQIRFMDQEVIAKKSFSSVLLKEKKLWDNNKAQAWQLISDIENEELRQLQHRETLASTNAQRTLFLFRLGVVFVFGLLCFFYYLINREIQLRNKAEWEVRTFNKELENRIEDRTVALQESEGRFSRIANSAPVMIFVTEKNGQASYWNDVWLSFVGRPLEAEINWGWKDHLHPEDADAFLALYADVLEKQLPFKTETRVIRADGADRWVIIAGVPNFTPQSEFTGFVGTCTDITEQKRATEIAEDANKKKNQFLANMSHELRTPLNAIIGYSEMMVGGMVEDTEKQQKYMNAIARSGHHLLEMVNDILDIAKLETGKLKIQFVTIPLTEFTQELQTLFADTLDKKNISLNFKIQPGVETVYADSTRLKQIFLNLLSNAIKFNKAGGQIEVRLHQSADQAWVVCEIEDTGIGIPQNKLSEIFTEFYQVDSSYSRPHEGTGLGLALTQHLIGLHQGTISVTSTEGVGSTFTFQLPYDHAPVAFSNAVPVS